MRNILAISFVFLVILCISEHCNAGNQGGGGGWGGQGRRQRGLRIGYYQGTCRNVEDIVRQLTWKNVSANPTLPAKLLRLHFHDCFVRGCDASVLLDSTANNAAEKEAIPNLTVSGFEFIDFLKSELERACPGIVSCADIVALAARDAVSFQYKRLLWPVLTGREDGRVSSENDALDNLPSPFADFPTLRDTFNSKNLDIVDLVALSGAHTLGRTHCSLIEARIFNFTANGGIDPSLDPLFAQSLRTICPLPIDPAATLEMDPGSSTSFDSHYFTALKQNKVLFLSDAALLTNPQSARIATELQNPVRFFSQFALSMVKLGAVGVLTDGQGEIRKNCRVVNPSF